ncbi:MAG: hypothetical protein OMM_01896 [Candidatus Magnetoglobus multicellularis str. Araruama]|uniref:DUF1579 domain-containing protein n=1 Tax=Candidatus Magnetoglobus multicellularis str. Araruama TaxID=890399 RepID=A0A1V1PBS2_9BACT|nr:MAG: hypothetical protein OMM_01896 [Candidatus Magnetoglobus multicellularis str. Araruama]
MNKNVITIVVFASLLMVTSVAFATEDQVTLADAIKILKTLAGSHPPPAFDATGTWAVQSVQNGQKRTGEVFLDMKPDGTLKGYAELTSLQGLSNVTGIVHGLSFDLNLVSDYGSMTVHGTANSDGNNISGSFFLQDNVEVFWDGQRQMVQTYTGSYVHDPEENKFELTFEDGTKMTYTVTEFTATKLVLNQSMIWERSIAGEVGDFTGIWKNYQDPTVEQIMTLYPDHTFSIMQRLLTR